MLHMIRHLVAKYLNMAASAMGQRSVCLGGASCCMCSFPATQPYPTLGFARGWSQEREADLFRDLKWQQSCCVPSWLKDIKSGSASSQGIVEFCFAISSPSAMGQRSVWSGGEHLAARAPSLRPNPTLSSEPDPDPDPWLGPRGWSQERKGLTCFGI